MSRVWGVERVGFAAVPHRTAATAHASPAIAGHATSGAAFRRLSRREHSHVVHGVVKFGKMIARAFLAWQNAASVAVGPQP